MTDFMLTVELHAFLFCVYGISDINGLHMSYIIV